MKTRAWFVPPHKAGIWCYKALPHSPKYADIEMASLHSLEFLLQIRHRLLPYVTLTLPSNLASDVQGCFPEDSWYMWSLLGSMLLYVY